MTFQEFIRPTKAKIISLVILQVISLVWLWGVVSFSYQPSTIKAIFVFFILVITNYLFSCLVFYKFRKLKLFYYLVALFVILLASLVCFSAHPGMIDKYLLVPLTPTTDKQLFLPKEIQLEQSKNTKFSVGYYNANDTEATNAKVGIRECMTSEKKTISLKSAGSDEDVIYVISETKSVASQDSEAYGVVVVDNSEKVGSELTGVYLCTVVIFNSDLKEGFGSLNNPYTEKKFFIKII